jgi:hypothetical protein
MNITETNRKGGCGDFISYGYKKFLAHDKLSEGDQARSSQLIMLCPAVRLPSGEASRISRNINGTSREGLLSPALSFPAMLQSRFSHSTVTNEGYAWICRSWQSIYEPG